VSKAGWQLGADEFMSLQLRRQCRFTDGATLTKIAMANSNIPGKGRFRSLVCGASIETARRGLRLILCLGSCFLASIFSAHAQLDGGFTILGNPNIDALMHTPIPTRPGQTVPRPGEIDTAAQGGQAGGRQIGIQYSFAELRCQANEAIVGMRIRRGDVLDAVQVACAIPQCAAFGCNWSSSYWGPSAGNPVGGDAHPPMICGQNEMLAGIRARVVTFTRFDYAQDVEILCVRITSLSDGFYRIQPRDVGAWHQSDGGMQFSHWHGQVAQAYVTAPILCQPNGGVAAVSLGIANNFVNIGQRVVQAMSLYCPAAPARSQPPASCPTNLRVASLQDESALVRSQIFPTGRRTGGGAVATMQMEPDTQDWAGASVPLRETVRLSTNFCPVSTQVAQNVCGVGTNQAFFARPAGNFTITVAPAGTPLNINWQAVNNSFADTHFVVGGPSILDSPGWPAGQSCTITCSQTYSCGVPPNNRTYGPFTIFYFFFHDTFQPGLFQPSVPVTRVQVSKQ
jgi:hypothetical protein